jgi:hypothetical protein
VEVRHGGRRAWFGLDDHIDDDRDHDRDHDRDRSQVGVG